MAKLSVADAMAEFHAHMVADNRHGYSQPNRYGTGSTHAVQISDGTRYQCRNGDKDCSSSVAEVVGQVCGIPEPFTYTGDQDTGLIATGLFKRVPAWDRKRGDILWRKGHTAIYQGDGRVSEFVRSERYSINGQTGDQDGGEAAINIDPNNWTVAYRYIGPPREDPPKPPRVPTPVPADVPPRSVLRMYNPNSGEHFFTKSVTEAKKLVAAGWDCEGVAWRQPEKGDKVYRLYNPNAGDHHYTTNAAERNHLVKQGWKDEGVAFFAGGSKNVYRLYNPNSGRHHYTTNKAERDMLKKTGWKDEGIGWKVE